MDHAWLVVIRMSAEEVTENLTVTPPPEVNAEEICANPSIQVNRTNLLVRVSYFLRVGRFLSIF